MQKNTRSPGNEYPIEYDANGKTKRCRNGYAKTKHGTCKKKTSTPQPTRVPTPQPTRVPTPQPTRVPTPQPTRVPTPQPTRMPTPQPTRMPTPQPFSESAKMASPDEYPIEYDNLGKPKRCRNGYNKTSHQCGS